MRASSYNIYIPLPDDPEHDKSLINSIWLKINIIPAHTTENLVHYMRFLFDKSVVLVVLPSVLFLYILALDETANMLTHLDTRAYVLGFFGAFICCYP